MKKNFIILAVVVILMVAVAAVVSTFAKNRAASDPNFQLPSGSGGTGTGSGSTSTAPAALDYSKKLGYGSKGPEVSELQRLYNASKFVTAPLVVDGNFGTKTTAAVVKVMGFGVTSTTLADFSKAVAGTTASADQKTWLSSIFPGLKL